MEEMGDLRRKAEAMISLEMEMAVMGNGVDREVPVMELLVLGKVLLYYVFRDPKDKLGIFRAFITKGSMIPKHVHEGDELILCYEGTLIVETQQGRRTLHPKEIMKIEKGVFHSFEAKEENCWCLWMAIPATKGYPDIPRSADEPNGIASDSHDGTKG